MEKTLAAISYFIDKRGGATVTELMKLCYLTDLVISKGTGKRKLTNFKYVRWYYGPFDKNIYKYLEMLSGADSIKYSVEYTAKGAEAIVYKYNDKKKTSYSCLTGKERQVLDAILEGVAGLGPAGLTKLAYATAPLRKMNVKIGDNKKIGEAIVF